MRSPYNTPHTYDVHKSLFKSSDFLWKKKIYEWMHVCMIMLKYIENMVWLGP